MMADSNTENIPVKALRKNTLQIISQLLNPRKVIPTENGLPRDWQGLADLVKIGGEHLPYLQNNPDPTREVLNLWHKRNAKESTIDNLINFLEALDRFDIIDDVAQLISEDVSWYKENGNKCDPDPIDLDSDKYILTRDDVLRVNEGLSLQNYDAFVLFADDDINFATELIDTMEKQYNMKLCVKYRDLVGGSMEHEAIIKLISERCNRLIVILSPAFLNSPANSFFCVFAQAIGIEQRQRKVIPCLLGACQIPAELKHYVLLDYKRSGKLFDFWDRLYHSVRTPTPPQNKIHENGLSTQKKSLTQQTLKPALHQENNLLGTKKESVKFRSMVDVNKIDSEILPDPHLNTSSSLNAITNEPKKVKTKNGWLNKILNHKSDKTTSNGIGEKRKKRLWPIKRKPLADN